MSFKVEAIGITHSCFKVKFGTPRQSQIAKNSQAYIEIFTKWEPSKCLKGLENFSHAWILFWFHDNKNLIYKPIVRPPRLGRKGIGALATRSPLRPNPIGLSLVKIEKVEKNRIYFSGVDIIEGTPVIDIKPYIHQYDYTSHSKSGWLENIESENLQVEFSQEALEKIKELPHAHLKKNIEDILKSDIRNRNDKNPEKSKKILGFYYENLNILFQSSEKKVLVLKIEYVKN